MIYYKQVKDGYILGIGTGNSGTEITETEYNDILSAIRNKPQRTATTDYRLKTDLTWEEYSHEPDQEPELDADEIVDIIFGGAV